MKFDICIMNPPYSNGLCEKFFLKGLETALVNVSVMPATWLLGKRQNKKITEYFDKFGGTIELIDGNRYFDAAISGLISINYINQEKDGEIGFDNKQYLKCSDIKSYSNDEFLMEFKNIVEPLYLKDNIDNHLKAVDGAHYKRYIIENPKNNPYIIIIPQFAGSSTVRSKLVGEFYAMYSKYRTFENTGGKFNDLNIKKSRSGTKLLKFYILFITEEETYNFWKYTHTLFFLTCMRLIKTALDEIGGGELKYIPWFDFSDSMFEGTSEDIDIALFKKYNISLEIVDHILELIPNYYNLDLNKYKTTTYYDKQERIIFDGKWYKECGEIKSYSNDELLVEFKNIVEPLYLKDNLKNHLKYTEGLTGHVLHKSFHEDKSPNENGWCVRVISFSPGAGSDGFYTLISKNGLNDYGQYKDMKNKTIIFGGKKKKFMEYYYMFNNKQDCINFINYIQTDFCRICLYLVKTNMHIIANGATKNIPWFDFSDPVFSKSPSEIDDYLFAKYIPEVDEKTGITRDEIRKHIEDILTDYYGIRKQ